MQIPINTITRPHKAITEGTSPSRTIPDNVLAMLSGKEVNYKAIPFRTPNQPSDKIKFQTLTVYHFDRGGNGRFKLAGPTRKERIEQSIKKAGKDGGLGKSIHTIFAVDPYASN